MIPTVGLDCDCILCHILGVSRGWILCHSDFALEQNQVQSFLGKIDRRCCGFPVAYIVGKKEFYGREFFVSPAVLVPKPDTEILVEKSLLLLEGLFQKKKSVRVVDVCTGSGCVAVSVWKELSKKFELNDCNFFAADISREALDIAKKNCSNHSAVIECILADLLLDDKLVDLDMILANPPYVPHCVANELLEDGRSEPLLALDGDRDGTRDGTGLIARLIPQGFKALNPGGYLILETGEYNAEITGELMRKSGFVDVRIHRDLAGTFRVVEGRKS